MNRFNFLNILGLSILSLGLMACQTKPAPIDSGDISDPWGVVIVQPGEYLQIAAVTSLNAEILGLEGREHLRGIELAVTNTSSVHGFPVRVVAVESECSADDGVFAAEELTANSSLLGVVGHSCAVSCAAAADLYTQSSMVLVSPACSSTQLTDELLHSGSFFRTMYDDKREGTAAATFAYQELATRRVAIIHDGTIETTNLAESFAAAYTGFGGEIVSTQAVDSATRDYRPLLDALAPFSPDLIYSPLLPLPGSRIVRHIDGSLIAGTPVLGGKHFWSNWFIQEAGSEGEGDYAVGPYTTTSSYQALVETYALRYGEFPDSELFAFSYDATVLLLKTIEDTATILASGQMIIGRQAVHNTLFRTYDYPGVTGQITCTTRGDCSVGTVSVGVIENQQWSIQFVP